MRTSIAVVSTALAAAVALCGEARVAHAAFPNGNNSPNGPGTEQVDSAGHIVGIQPGWEASGAAGTGFAGTYAFGALARVGYTFDFGMTLGGNAQAYWGNSFGSERAHATFVGPEIGYKLFPLREIEVRPYAFIGAAFITQVGGGGINSHTGVGVQPGVLATYHIGKAFIGGDAHMLTTPGPVSLAIMATGGAGF